MWQMLRTVCIGCISSNAVVPIYSRKWLRLFYNKAIWLCIAAGDEIAES